jgi:hypothetical protein
MNKILLALLCLSLFLCLNLSSTYCSTIGQVNLLDTISPKDVCISRVLIGSKKNNLLSSFGTPDSVISHIDEFEGTEFQEYIYLRSSFYIDNNVFYGFDIRDSIFQFDYGKIKVGDEIEVLEKEFPKSYSNRERGETETTIRVKINKTDSYILFFYNKQTITRIMLWNDL